MDGQMNGQTQNINPDLLPEQKGPQRDTGVSNLILIYLRKQGEFACSLPSFLSQSTDMLQVKLHGYFKITPVMVI